MGKLIAGLALLALVGCGEIEQRGRVTCPDPLPSCGATAAYDPSIGLPAYSCGDMAVILYANGGACCLQGQPAGYVPTAQDLASCESQ
jgi:hypothetical protein